VELSTVQVASEIIHRAAALAVSVAGLILLFLVLTRYRSQRKLLLLTLAAGATLAVQVSLGALTIFSALEAAVVTAHLAVATLFFALTIFIAQEGRRVAALPDSGPARSAAPGEAPNTAS
jgi:heme A synthase